MATFEDGINGGFKGKVGNVVGYKWKDIWVLRSLPKPSKKPRSQKQLANQAKMALMQELLQITIDFVQKGFSRVPQLRRMSAFNAAMSYNKKNAIKGEFPDLEIDFEKFMFAHGDLDFPENLHIEQQGKQIEITWDIPDQYSERNSDQILFLMIDRERANAFGITSGVQQAKGIEVMDLTGIPASREYGCYVAFISDDRTQLSDSVYWGSLRLT